jgi:hypothetical protein
VDRDPSDLLWAWETGATRRPPERALLAVSAALPDSNWDDLVRMPLGRRTRELLVLREALLGPRLECVVDCPECGDTLSVEFRLNDMLALSDANGDWLKVELGAYVVTFRVLNSGDLQAVAEFPSVEDARVELISRCVVDSTRRRRDGRNVRVAPSRLPTKIIAALSDALVEADPLADLRIRATCLECGHAWYPRMDVAALVWNELGELAGRTLDDVSELARAFGWPEADILGMSPARRKAYLDRVHDA